MIKVAVVDDQQIVLNGFKYMFEKAQEEYGFDLVFTCTTGHELLGYLDHYGSDSVDIVIIDFKMPGMSGFQLIRKINRLYSNIKTVIYSSYHGYELIESAISDGANSYFKKDIGYPEMMEALMEIINTGYHFPEGFPQNIIKKLLDGKKIKPTYNLEAHVTEREKEAITLIAKGLTSKEVGIEMNISSRTVEEYKKNFCQKTGCNKTSGITVYCYYRGWIDI